MRHAILVDKVGHSHHTQHNSSISFSSWCFLYLVYYSSHSICRQLLQSGHSILHRSLGVVGQMQIILSHQWCGHGRSKQLGNYPCPSKESYTSNISSLLGFGLCLASVFVLIFVCRGGGSLSCGWCCSLYFSRVFILLRKLSKKQRKINDGKRERESREENVCGVCTELYGGA